MVNLQNLPDDDFSQNMKQQTDRILAEVEVEALNIRKTVEGRLWN